MTKDFSYEISEHLIDLSQPKNGWVKQLNKVKWGNSAPVLDLRPWHYPDNSNVPDRMGKGITLTKDELKTLSMYLNTYDFDQIDLPF